jgi:hypothetical protein
MLKKELAAWLRDFESAGQRASSNRAARRRSG